MIRLIVFVFFALIVISVFCGCGKENGTLEGIKYALSGSDDKTLKLWDVDTGREIKTFSGHTYRVTSVSFSPDGRYVLSGSPPDGPTREEILKLWDVNTGKEVKTFSGHEGAVTSVAFGPDV